MKIFNYENLTMIKKLIIHLKNIIIELEIIVLKLLIVKIHQKEKFIILYF